MPHCLFLSAHIMKNINWNAAKPHAIAIGIMLIFSLIYFYPVLQGKVMIQMDMVNAECMVHEAKTYADKMDGFVPWSNAMFGGMPVFYTDHIANFFIRLPYALEGIFNQFSFDVLLWLFLGMYVFLAVLGFNWQLAVLGALAFGLSSFNILSLEAGHVQKLLNIAFVPPLIGAIILVFRGNYLWGLILGALTVNFLIGLGHHQVTYYAAIAAVVVSIFYAIEMLKNKETARLGKSIGILALTAVLGLLPNYNLLNTYNHSKETTRGGGSELKTEEENKKEGNLDYDYATQWSYGRLESFTFIVPNIMGGANSNYLVQNRESATARAIQANARDEKTFYQYAQESGAYWGAQPFVGGPIYFGAVICLFFVLGFVVVKDRSRWWYLAVFVVFLLLAWGKNSMLLFDFFFYNVPFFSKFRTPSMALSLVQLAVAGLAVAASAAIMQSVDEKDKAKTWKNLLIAGGVYGGILAILWLMPGILLDFTAPREVSGSLPDWLLNALTEDRKELAQKDALRSLIFAGLAFAAVWALWFKKIKPALFIPAIALLAVIDLWGFNNRYLNKENFKPQSELKKIYQASPASASILQDTDPNFRVFNVAGNNPFSDALTSYHHKSIGGYHGAKLRRYQELIENQISRNNMQVLSMLNTKYFIVRGQDNQPQPQRNPYAMGNAWFVPTIKWVQNGREEMDALSEGEPHNFNAADFAIIQENEAGELKGWTPVFDSSATIQLTNYLPGHITYSYTSASDQLAVLSEIFYRQPDGDGWKLYLDGQEISHYKCNYVLIAAKLPAGNHKLELIFKADKHVSRERVTFAGASALLLICLGLAWWQPKFLRKED